MSGTEDITKTILEPTTTDEETDDETGADRKALDGRCHRCDERLTSGTGVIKEGWRVRTGTCPNCRLDGVGGAAFVTVDPDAITENVQRQLAREQNGNAQTPYSAAVFLDWNAPAGEYAVRRVQETVLRIDLPDDISYQKRIWLSEHLRNVAGDTWFVQSFPSRINLVDKRMHGEPDHDEGAIETYQGP